MAMIKRQPLFPHVIELNHQARRRISCSVYLVFDDANNWALIDIGYEDAVDECLEIIRQLDFPFSKCVTLIASHADVDHVQGFAKAKQILKATVTAHPQAAKAIESGDKLVTYAEVAAQEPDQQGGLLRLRVELVETPEHRAIEELTGDARRPR